MKIIAYLPGCEIIRLDIPLTQLVFAHLLQCKKLMSQIVFGKIRPLCSTATEVLWKCWLSTSRSGTIGSTGLWMGQ